MPILTVQNQKVKCPLISKSQNIRQCFECGNLKSIQPKDGGKLECKSE